MKDFSHSSPGALSGLTSTLLFQPCTSLPSCAFYLSHEAPPVDLIKTRLQQGDASLRTESVLPVLMRANLTFLSIQSSWCYSLHHAVDRFFLRGTRSLARHIRVVNPVHSFASSFRFLMAVLSCMRILITRVSQQRPGHSIVFHQLKSSPWLHGRFTHIRSGSKMRIRKALLRSPHADQFGEPPGWCHHPCRCRLRIEPLLSAQGSVRGPHSFRTFFTTCTFMTPVFLCLSVE